jgi:DNA-binding Lrp family transcriptional regulator
LVGSKLEREIIGIFNRDICAFLSINQISKKLNKAYPHINAKVNELLEEGILTKYEIGRSYQCSINLNNEKAVALLTLNESEKKEQAISKIKNNKALSDELLSIRKQFKVFTIILNKDELIFVLDYLYDREAIKNMSHQLSQFDLIFLGREDFKKYALENIRHQNDWVILYSCEKYFELLSEIKESLIIRNISNMKDHITVAQISSGKNMKSKRRD